jgi:2-keto-4-pentenoate hydratase/2-oxohepta-3-ene-1,7-dioic acid hydratase in catechol pathway
MRFSFEEVIEYISQEADIVPGDLLGSGTIGMGCGLERDSYLKPGMTVELEAEGIGALRNILGEQGPRSPIGAAL